MNAMVTTISRGLLMIATLFGSAFAAEVETFDHEFTNWDSITKQYVRWLPDNVQSRVDYAGLARERTRLAQVLSEYSSVSQATFGKWNQHQQMAFLINAYNAFTVELILTKYPDLRSIKDLGSFLESPWKRKFFTLLGARHNLDWIEHEMLRARYHDPRIHTAIVCASIGCPALLPGAYTAAKLDQQLEDGMRRFVSDPTRNRYRAGKLEVSSIFDWFKGDFEKGHQGYRSVGDVFARYAGNLTSDPRVEASIRAKAVPITFLDYNWMLNDSAR